MKNILVIGMGRFGSRLATKLLELGNDVMIIDADETIIDKYSEIFENALVADCTNSEVIKTINVKNFDVCFVAIGDNFEASLVITALLKEYGAKKVVCKASQDIQVNILNRIGADEVIDPEYDIAEKYAVMHSGKELFDYIELEGSEYDIYEINVLDSWVGKSIVELDVRVNYDINIIGVRKKDDSLKVNPSPNYVFEKKDHVVVIATADTISGMGSKFKKRNINN